MRSAGFGRRIVEPSGHELVLVPGQGAPSAPPELANREELKEQIRTALMSRIDPSVAGRIARRVLRAEITKLVSEIATEQRIQLNETEEAALATELTDDMVGLGPLEPLLEDDDVTDVLVNGPFDVFVERRGKLEKTNARFRDAQHLVSVAQRIAAAIGRRIDEASPMVDARLADGSRVNIVLRELVRNALRMRPDRIIVGEVRGPEAFDMLQAMNTGHDGSMTTVHANSPRDALYRVENMVMMANLSLPLKAIRMQVASALNLIVHIERMRDGVRRVQNVAEIAGMEGDIITARELFTFRYQGEKRAGTIDGIFESTRMRPDFITRAARYGLDRELLDVLGIVAAMR